MRISKLVTLFAVLGGSITSGADNLTDRPGEDSVPTEVRMQLVLLDLEEIRGADQNFTANFAWSARWLDERLRHDGGGPKRVFLKDIWHPSIQIVNRQRLQNTFEAEALVSPDGQVSMVQRVWGQFSQPLKLRDFPYDSQTLNVDLVATGHSPGSVILVEDPKFPSGVGDRLSITDWQLVGWDAGPLEVTVVKGGRKSPGFKLSLNLEREHRYHLVNVILPLAMIIGMSWVVFWIAPKNANPRISVSVTAMLTLIAYRFAVGANLPKIGYLTRMDWFILGSSVLIFASLMEVVITSWMAENNRMETAISLNRKMRVVAPVLFALVAWASLLR